MKSKKIKVLAQFIKFGVVGLSNTIISYAVYAGLTYLGVYYIVSNLLGFVLSVLNAFYWSNKYVFKKGKNEYRNIVLSLIKTFVSYGFTGIVLSNLLLYVFVEYFKQSKYLTPIAILIITIPLNFLLNKFWAYKTVRKEDAHEQETD